MSRVKLYEVDAKRLLFPALNIPFHAYSATSATKAAELAKAFPEENLVVKIDQGVKKRGKQGLVKVNVTPREVVSAISEWSKAGWKHFIVEPVVEHATVAEHYLALERTRDNWRVSYSEHGGVEIESAWDTVAYKIPDDLRSAIYDRLIPALEKYHIVFLEMNPVVIRGSNLFPLDMAAEIDSAALGLAELMPYNIIPVQDHAHEPSEVAVAALDASTPASLKFRLINPNGRIWMFLSGGGASLVLADEVADQGMGDELANYGEYSGAPTDDDVYAYTKVILFQILKSKIVNHKSIAIIVAGGVANFTDVKKTFSGLIRALDEMKENLTVAKVKIFVRRGGPNEAAGLAAMEKFLKESDLYGSVHGHEIPLTKVVTEVKEYLGRSLSRGDSSTGDPSNARVGTAKLGGVSPKEFK